MKDDIDEVISLIDDSFEADSDSLLYYRLHNVSKGPEEAVNDFLNQENKSLSAFGETSNYCQECSSESDEEKTDDLPYSKSKIDSFKETLLNLEALIGHSLFYAICYAL